MISPVVAMVHAALGQESPIDVFKRLVLAATGTLYVLSEEEFYSLYSYTRRFAQLMLFPGAYKSGVIYAMRRDGQLFSITFSRSGSATRINASGVMESVTTDIPRLDYDPVTLKPKGYLIEPSTTNTFVNSDNATSWGSISACAVATYSGTLLPSNSGLIITPNTNNTQHGVLKLLSTSFPAAGSVVSFSFYLKANGYSGALVYLYDRGSTTAIRARAVKVNLSTGTIVSTGNLQSTEVLTIENSGGGWYRVKWENWQTQATNTLTPQVEVYPIPLSLINTGGVNAPIYAGTGTSSILITGFQVEVSASCTSYIPTPSGSQVTRPADSIELAGLQAAGIFNVDQGTVIFKGAGTGELFNTKTNAGTTVHKLHTTKLENVAETVNTADGQKITTKGGWRWLQNGRDTFAHSGTVYENVNPTVNAYAIDKITAPTSPVLLKTLALFKTAISNTDMSTITN